MQHSTRTISPATTPSLVIEELESLDAPADNEDLMIDGATAAVATWAFAHHEGWV
ncbi:hypothetical protein ACIBCO_39730 [Streptomyces violascens]|uniref:hypothetical protein n=1 Tax=Streptomyces violascens TaxID=67381 RepID=UPI00378E1086